MSWHCSRALVAAFSAGTCSDGAASALSNTTPTPDQFYWPDKTTEHSRLSRFGMTCVPLMGDLGAAVLTWFLAGSRARTSAQPEKVTALMGREVGSGRKWLGLLARYDPDSRSWRTPQCSLLEDWGRVLGDLAALGFDAEWGVVGADDCGAPHKRERIWIVAHANGLRELQPARCECDERDGACQCGEVVADRLRQGLPLSGKKPHGAHGREAGGGFAPGRRWPVEPGLDRMAHGVANRADRLKAIGNGQVPRVAATAWQLLSETA